MYELSRVFTLLVDGKPTLAFEARNTQQAQEIRKEHRIPFFLGHWLATACALTFFDAAFQVPELTRSAGIQLNKRVPLSKRAAGVA
jgi:hypothetical protein